MADVLVKDKAGAMFICEEAIYYGFVLAAMRVKLEWVPPGWDAGCSRLQR